MSVAVNIPPGPALTIAASVDRRSRRCAVLLRRVGEDVPFVQTRIDPMEEEDRIALIGKVPPDLQEEAEGLLEQLAFEVEKVRIGILGKATTPSDAVPPGGMPPAGPPAGGSAHPGEEGDGPIVIPFTDDALALAFSARYADDLRHTATWGRWFHWVGSLWKQDSTLEVFDLVRGVCRETAATCGDAKVRATLVSAKTVSAVERLAKADRRHAVTDDVWDRDRWILNTPGGVVDLRTGELRPHRRDDYCIRQTAVTPGGDAPLWIAFLDRITGGDTELQAFLRRMAGYALTGSVEEHALFFCYGTGRNGKGTFIETISRALRTYAKEAPIETFTASHGDRHPTELAQLRGARLVTSQETEEGRRWAESRIKALTGGDPITARFMRGDFFTFEPEFKLLLAGNHKPSLRSVDVAMRRRLHLIPFTQTIPESERDPKLREKLVEQLPGVLQWMIDGCLEWIEVGGLRPPESVLAATEEYFEEEDTFSEWLREACSPRPGQWESFADLYRSWGAWCETRGDKPGAAKSFTRKLTEAGFERQTSGHGNVRGFAGIVLKRDSAAAYRVA